MTHNPSASWRLALRSDDPRFPGLPEDLRRRAEEVLASDRLAEAVLYGHLLLERALEILIRNQLRRPDVLDPGGFARLAFAQKITIYVGLYDPPQERIELLRAFNRLRNRMAHSLADLEEATRHEFANVTVAGAFDAALDKVKSCFLYLALMELGVIHGARVVDGYSGATPPALTEQEGAGGG